MEKKFFEELLNMMKQLRGKGGCPWDREQTIDSLKPFLIEECYEVIDAIEKNDPLKIQEELGDLLFQIIFLAQIGREEGWFDMAKILGSITEKIRRRHPHVFSDDVAKDASEVLAKWEKIKQEETKGKNNSVLDGLPKGLPAIVYAHRVQEKAARVGFDWERLEEVLEKLDEEILEFKDALKDDDRTKCEAEMGDIFFTLVNVARFLKIEPDGTLRKATLKFIKRFQSMEMMIQERGESIRDLNLKELDRYWESVKKQALTN